jgi:hypothetical protein
MTVAVITDRLPRVKRVPRLLDGPPGGGPVGLLDHERMHGPLPLPGAADSRRADQERARRLIDVVERAGLTGRGSLTIGRSARGGAGVTLALGATAAPREADRRHRIIRHRASRPRHADPRLTAELSEWSAIVGHDVTSS